MNYSELEGANPRLFWDGICRGSIPYSSTGALDPGGVVTNAFAERFVGGPFPPISVSFNPNSGSIPYGAGDNYPKPWRSYAQRNSDAAHSINVGPFARLIKIPDNLNMDNTCVGGTLPSCGGADGGIYGRLGVSGGELAFRAMDWYNQDEGSLGTAFWNNELNEDWQTWKKWWDGASKATVNARWVDPLLDFVVEVEVAYDTPDVGDERYYPGINGAVYADNSLDLLVAMVAIAAAARWIL